MIVTIVRYMRTRTIMTMHQLRARWGIIEQNKLGTQPVQWTSSLYGARFVS